MVFSSHTLSLNGWSLFISHGMLGFASQRAFHVQARRGKGVMWVFQEGEVTRSFLVAAQQEVTREEASKQTKTKIAWMVGRWSLSPAEKHSFTMGLFSARDVWHRPSLLCHVKVKMKHQRKPWQGRWGNRASEKSVRSAGTWGIIISPHLMDVLMLMTEFSKTAGT